MPTSCADYTLRGPRRVGQPDSPRVSRPQNGRGAAPMGSVLQAQDARVGDEHIPAELFQRARHETPTVDRLDTARTRDRSTGGRRRRGSAGPARAFRRRRGRLCRDECWAWTLGQPVPKGPGASECWSVSQNVLAVSSCSGSFSCPLRRLPPAGLAGRLLLVRSRSSCFLSSRSMIGSYPEGSAIRRAGWAGREPSVPRAAAHHP